MEQTNTKPEPESEEIEFDEDAWADEQARLAEEMQDGCLVMTDWNTAGRFGW